MTYKDVLIFIDQIRKCNYRLNEWETDFIESIETKSRDLTLKQSKCLEDIYKKAAGGGIYIKREKG